MPFTPTHVLAVAPIAAATRALPFSALAIGAMVPDMPMFLPLSSYDYAHGWPGILVYSLPVGLLCFLLFHGWLKQPLLALWPAAIQRRLGAYARYQLLTGPQYLLAVVVALIIGILSHVVWDAFTHAGGWGVRVLPLLEQSVTVAGRELPRYKILQYASTLVGLPMLAIMLAVTLRNTEAKAEYAPPNPGTTLVAATWFAIIMIAVVALLQVMAMETSTAIKVGLFIRRTIAAWLLTAPAYAIVYIIAVRNRCEKRPEAADDQA